MSKEVEGVELEARLARRASYLIDAMSEKPDLGFPEVFDSDADLEAAYRFFGNPAVTFEGLLRPHIAKSVERISKEKVVLSLEDTTEFAFGGNKKREGLGRLNTQTQGFLGHFALSVEVLGESSTPLGVVGVETYTRAEKHKGRRSTHQRYLESDRESKRWGRMVRRVERNVAGAAKVIHVMDREGDIYELIAWVLRESHFVIRACQNRSVGVLDPDGGTERTGLLFDEMRRQPALFTRETHISFRPESKLPGRKKSHPARAERDAVLSVSAARVRTQRPARGCSHLPEEVSINAVRVFEQSPPENEPAVEWVLLTSEPIDTIDQIETVVRYYLKRWLIEEFFKAIKTGCAYEKRQLETYKSLRNALALTIPIAWQLLVMRAVSRSKPDEPAETVFHPTTLTLLRSLAKRYPLPAQPTVRDAVHSIAGMGGWLKRNGNPGWLTLARGYQKLLYAAWVARSLVLLDSDEPLQPPGCVES